MFDGNIWLWDRCWKMNIRENIGWKWREEKWPCHHWPDKKEKKPCLYPQQTKFYFRWEGGGELWDPEQAVLTALAHGISSAIIFRNILHGRYNEIHISTSLLMVYWEDGNIREGWKWKCAFLAYCWKGGWVRRGVGGGGEVEEKSCKCSLKTVKFVCNVILSEDFFLISKERDNLQLSIKCLRGLAILLGQTDSDNSHFTSLPVASP